MLEKIISDAKKHFSSCEVVHFVRNANPVVFESGRLKKINSTVREGYCIRAIKDGKMAFASTTKPGDVAGLIQAALDTAPYSPPAEFDFAVKAAIKAPSITSPETQALTIDKMIEMGKRAVEALSGLHKDALVGVHISKASFLAEVATSNGFSGSYKRDEFSWGAGVDLVEGENMLSAGSGFAGVAPAFDERAKIEETIEQFQKGMKNVSAKTGKYKVLFHSGAFTHAMNIIEASFMGKSVEKKVSTWTDKLGQKVADERVTLLDDGLMAGRNFSTPFDDEGTPTQTLPVIDKGILKSFLVDRRTAKKLGMAPTGNGFKKAGLFSPPPEVEVPPAISHTTLALKGGNRPHKDMLKGLEEGIYVCDLIGTMMGNPLTGQLAGNIALGYLVKNGEIVGRIKDAMISVNLFDALQSSIIEISSDLDVSGWNGDMVLPYMLLDGCTVALG